MIPIESVNKSKNFQTDHIKYLFLRSDGKLEDEIKESNLLISGEETLAGDKIVTCKVSVTAGTDQRQLQYDTLAYLKTFAVRLEMK